MFAGLALSVLFVATLVIPNAKGLESVPQPSQPVTELYFTDHIHLPTTYYTGESQSVDFTIDNLEGHALTYSYRVEVNGVPTGGTRTARLDNRQAERFEVAVPIAATSTRASIAVNLVDLNQTIQYWVTRVPGPA